MRYRKEDTDGDYVLGGAAAFLVNSPEAVAQAVGTRLRLIRGEWFVDKSTGMPWQDVVGKQSQDAADADIRDCILGTQGVTEITEYESTWDSETRGMRVLATIDTVYGTTKIDTTL